MVNKTDLEKRISIFRKKNWCGTTRIKILKSEKVYSGAPREKQGFISVRSISCFGQSSGHDRLWPYHQNSYFHVQFPGRRRPRHREHPLPIFCQPKLPLDDAEQGLGVFSLEGDFASIYNQ